jgi:hypothetical protein
VAVIENKVQREREYILLLAYLGAEIRATPTKDQVEVLRLAFLMFIETVIILDAAIAQVAGERLKRPISLVPRLRNQDGGATPNGDRFINVVQRVGS